MIGKLRLLLWIGIVLLFLPYLGFPDIWRTVLTIILGISIILLSFKLKYEYKKVKFELHKSEEQHVHE